MNKKASVRRKADKALQDYIRTKYKHEPCWVCLKALVSCGHHFVSCASSNATRYYLPNIIPICRECHCKVTFQPFLVNPKICFKLGEEWYNNLMEVKRRGMKGKANLQWYQDNLDHFEQLKLQEEIKHDC